MGFGVVDFVFFWRENEFFLLQKVNKRMYFFHVCPFVDLVGEEGKD